MNAIDRTICIVTRDFIPGGSAPRPPAFAALSQQHEMGRRRGLFMRRDHLVLPNGQHDAVSNQRGHDLSCGPTGVRMSGRIRNVRLSLCGVPAERGHRRIIAVRADNQAPRPVGKLGPARISQGPSTSRELPFARVNSRGLSSRTVPTSWIRPALPLSAGTPKCVKRNARAQAAVRGENGPKTKMCSITRAEPLRSTRNLQSFMRTQS